MRWVWALRASAASVSVAAIASATRFAQSLTVAAIDASASAIPNHAIAVTAHTIGLQHDVSRVHGLRAFVRFRRGPASWVRRRVRGVFALRPAVAAVAAAGSAIEALQHAA